MTSCNQKSDSKQKERKLLSALYTLPIPWGWETELFSIPIKFAPEIKYKGVEEIRFAPGWSKVSSNEYWTYCFLWCLENKPGIDANILQTNLKAYYTGLINTNIQKGKTYQDKKYETETAFTEIKTENGDLATFSGTIRMLDYMQQEPIILNCIAHLKFCPQQKSTFLFHEISPKPFTDTVWNSLNKIWAGFSCTR